MERKITILLLVCLTVSHVTGQAQEVAFASCVEGASATEIVATFRVRKNSVDITELTAYSQDGVTPQTGACTIAFTGSITELVLTFDTAAALPCGIVQDGATTTQYNIRVHVIGPSIDQAYTFSCSSVPADLASTAVTTGPLTVKGALALNPLYERTRRVTFMARLTGSDLPATTLDLGQSMYYSITLDKGTVSYENTNWGRKFHVGFLKTDPASVLSIDVYTPSIGTRVRVTGTKAGETIDATFSVNRDTPALRYIIPSTYQPTSVVGTWNTEDLGILIEGLDDVIGVRVDSDNGFQQTDSYVAFPDEALEAGLYRIPTVVGGGTTAQAVIVGIEDGTTLTLSDDAGASTLPGGGATLSVTLDSLETYHLYCGTLCYGVSISADKPVAVISGNGQDPVTPSTTAGHLVTPALPHTKFGKKFVIVNLDADVTTSTIYKVLHETPDFTTTVDWSRPSGVTSIHDGDSAGNPIVLTGVSGDFSAEELETDGAVAASVTQFLTGTNTFEPSMVVIPPIEGWGTEQVLPLTEGAEYIFVIVSTKGDVADISFSTNSDAGDTISNEFSIVPVDVTPITGAATYEFDVITIPSQPGDSWIKFAAVSKTKPFMLLAYEIFSDDRVQAYAPIGQRTPTINPAGGCMPSVAVAGFYPGVRLNNGLDDDCDGKVDEEIPNGIDDDGDNLIDEDTASAPAMGGDFVALANTGLSIAADNAFTLPTGVAPVEVILPSGCNANSGSDPNTVALASVGHFTASTDDNTKYPDYYTIRTPDFMAFRFSNEPALWAKASVVLRDDLIGLSADSCSAKRRRRDADDGNSKEETVYLHLNIVDKPDNTTVTEERTTETCWKDAMFWSAVSVLMVTLVLEIAVVTVLRREKLRNAPEHSRDLRQFKYN